MSLELILDILMSAIVLAIYRADCQQQPALAYACVGSEPPLWGNHQEFYSRQVSPENYESSDVSHLITEDDVWVADPMDATPELDDLTLGELFAAADAIIPMDAEVAAELQAIDEEIDLLLPVRTKVATVVQLRALLKSKGWEYRQLPKATLNARALELLDRYDNRIEVCAVATFIVSDDKQSVLVLLK